MHSYVGKLNWEKYSVDETIVVVFPKGMGFKDPVQLYHQWTVTTDGRHKVTHTRNGYITTASEVNDVYEIHFYQNQDYWYKIKAVVSKDKKELAVTMSKKDGSEMTTAKLELHYSA